MAVLSCEKLPSMKWKSENKNKISTDDESEESGCSAKTNNGSIFFTLSIKVVRTIQRLCGLWGLLVAKNPIKFSIGCLLFVIFCGCGLFFINIIFVPYDLWVPEHSNFAKVINWTKYNFPPKYREHVGIWQSENVLSASFIQKVWDFHRTVKNTPFTIKNREEATWHDVCFKFPSNFSEESKNFAVKFWGKDDYKRDFVCYETSLLELWDYDSNVISGLDDVQVIEAINSVNTSSHYGIPRNFSHYLGGVERDKDGKIVKATTALHTWVTRIDYKAIESGDYEVDIGSGEKVDTAGVTWEKLLVKEVENFEEPEVEIMMNAGHSIGIVLYKALLHDSVWIGVGWTVLIVYVVLTLGKPTKKEHRIFPAFIGLLCIGMAVLASFGACSFMNIPYGTLNNVLPILLVALGVDDMYVIASAWDHIKIVDSLERKAQITLENAGMAITVTSVTDIIAFCVGASTSLPGLRWFCIYSAMGISMVYFLQATLFLASLVLNEKWINYRRERNGAKGLNYDYYESKDRFNLGKYLKIWGSWLMKSPVRWAVVAFTLLLFLFSSLSVVFMQQDFDALWLVPRASDLYKWFNTVETAFPNQREKGYIYFQGVNLPNDLGGLKKLESNISNLEYVMKIDAWFSDIDFEDMFERYPWLLNLSDEEQCDLVKQNLHIKYLNDFYFRPRDAGTHPCSTFRIEFIYNQLEGHYEKQMAMTTVRNIVENANISGTRGVWAGIFSQWERDGVILTELIRSLCLVLAAVWLIMLVLLASVRGSLIVTICVIFTLIDVASFVHYWGLTINSISSIAFILSVGICVDYAAHIVHNFLINDGTTRKRVENALENMGSAVLHGGFSTFLSFLLLAPSDSYIYNAYFKILSAVSIFGLFHSLVFLPIILCLLGPESYSSLIAAATPTPKILTQASSSPDQNDTELSILPVDSNNTSLFFKSDTPRCQPPPYTISKDTNFPPSYRKSSSLPSLKIIIADDNYSRNASAVSFHPSADKKSRHKRNSTYL